MAVDMQRHVRVLEASREYPRRRLRCIAVWRTERGIEQRNVREAVLTPLPIVSDRTAIEARVHRTVPPGEGDVPVRLHHDEERRQQVLRRTKRSMSRAVRQEIPGKAGGK